jgi:hypothetical protein
MRPNYDRASFVKFLAFTSTGVAAGGVGFFAAGWYGTNKVMDFVEIFTKCPDALRYSLDALVAAAAGVGGAVLGGRAGSKVDEGVTYTGEKIYDLARAIKSRIIERYSKKKKPIDLLDKILMRYSNKKKKE